MQGRKSIRKSEFRGYLYILVRSTLFGISSVLAFFGVPKSQGKQRDEGALYDSNVL